MEKQDKIKFWDHNEIRPSDEWGKEISNRLTTSDILLYLVSAASLTSTNCNRELAEALSAEIRVIILERCDWQNHQLGDIQVLPTAGKPINEWFPDAWVGEMWWLVFKKPLTKYSLRRRCRPKHLKKNDVLN